MKWMQRSMIALLVAGALSICLSGPVAAQPPNEQNGLVNVFVGDDLIAACVPITAAVDVVIGLCDLNVNAAVGVLARIITVDRTGRERQFCTVEDGPVIVTPDTDCPD